MKRTLIVLPLLAALLGGASLPACSHVKTNVSPVADVANAGGMIEDSAHAILVAAQRGNATIQPNGQPLVSRQALDDVALAVNRIGHLGLDLGAALNAYNAAKAAGSDTSAQKAAVQLVLASLNQALTDIGHAIPNQTIAAVDDGVNNILSILAQVRGAAL
jgi:hypothetical protein